MTGITFEAPPRSGEDIENLADAIRHAVGLENAPYFPVVEFLEFGLAEVVDGMFYDVQSADLLGGREEQSIRSSALCTSEKTYMPP